jgi:peptidoglycan/LPS O-acetylase OafA/YrhL
LHPSAGARILAAPRKRASPILTDLKTNPAGHPAAPAAAAHAGYRREIDGLRAVAVLPVILFHAGLGAFAGGYLGVDVFFVISGYLITGILARELREGRFSLARFYERRARRILPALAFVLLACVPVALAWLSPPALRDLAASFLATALSVSNFVFWQELDYFGPAAEHLPLLHTWSLGIEEQFYILFPLALAALWRGPRRQTVAILAVALVLSLAAAGWAARAHPSAGFFLLPFRAWELLVGALAALVARPSPSGPLALAGLLAVVGAMAAVPLALLPGVVPIVLACTGTALVLLHAAPGALAWRILAARPLVGVGLISYSAYLWHQPLLAFARIRFGEISPATALALGAAAILLAWPTWAFVERPFRRPSGAGPRRPLVAATWTITGLSLLGAIGVATNGLVGREPVAVRAILASVTDFNAWRDTCKTDLEEANPTHPVAGCLLEGTPGAEGPGVAFYGDSHADALQGAMFTLAGREGLRFYSVTRSACPPVPGLTRTPGGNLRCDDFVRSVERYVEDAGFGIVVLAARWTAGVAEGPFDNGEGGVEGRPGDFLVPVGAHAADDAERRAQVIATYVASVEDLLARGHRVVLVYPIPEAGWNVPEELARRREAAGHPLTLSTPLAAYKARQAAVIAAFDAIHDPNLFRVRPADLLCREIVPGRCVNSIGDQPLYFDDNHLNNTGALLVGERIMAAIAEARRTGAD